MHKSNKQGMNMSYVLQIIEDHPFLWFILLCVFFLLRLILHLIRLIPQIERIKSKIYLPLAKKYKHRRLVKAAIKSDIKGYVNAELRKMQGELPKGWINEMDIEWVTSENKEDFLNDDEVVVRIRPLEEQKRNFVNATYFFLKKAFFPKNKRVIPKGHHEASVLYVCRRIASARGQDFLTTYEDNLLEPAIEKHKKIPHYIEQYKSLDERGFFAGVFLREIHSIASEIRFTSHRGKMGNELISVINHLQKFIDGIKSVEKISDGDWCHTGPISSCKFLLVAQPTKTHLGVGAYVKRATESIVQGASRLYVFGSEKEKGFAEQVITAIDKEVKEYSLEERFTTLSDYRGDPGGVGAFFIKNKNA